MEISAPESYCLIHQGVQAALAACGIASDLTPASTKESEACNAKPVRFDIVAAEQSEFGAARAPPARPCSTEAAILLPDQTRNSDLRRFPKRLGLMMINAAELTPAESTRAADLERDRYTAKAWNYSR